MDWNPQILRPSLLAGPMHEFGHGVTWRMIGAMSGPLSGAIGEGMSDVLAILINNDDTVGEHSYNNTNGIRSAPYTGYSRTYGDMATTRSRSIATGRSARCTPTSPRCGRRFLT